MQKAQGIVWDLSELYGDAQDSRLTADIDAAISLGENFQKEYRGKIADCDADTLLSALQSYEQLLERGYRPYAMANLLFSGDGRSDEYKALVARVQDAMTQLSNATLFFSLEIQKISENAIRSFFESGKLDGYRHYLESLRLFTPYMLSEREEQIINQKNLAGKTAFVNLFDEFTAAFEWQLEVDGEMKTLTSSEVRELQRHHNPEVRRMSKQAHDGKYGENALVFNNVLGNLIKDHAIEVEMRGYTSPIQPTHLNNKVPDEVYQAMVDVTVDNYTLLQQYNGLKARMLGIPKLTGSDLYAPLTSDEKKIPFEEGKELVLAAFNSFSPEFGKTMQRVFADNWIDAEIRPGKRGGAFCYSIAPSIHPYILMNYVDNLNSVYTMAHEMGHALHTVLASEKNSMLSFHSTLVLAETASVFAEMLLTRQLLAVEKELERRKQILASKLEDFFATISRQTMYTLFELDVHLEGAKRRLSAEDFCNFWLKRREQAYGDSVEFLPEEKWFWSVIPHFIHTRFYCYAYTFGALFVLALFNRYEEEGEAFVPRYRALLAAGDSDWPETLIRSVGLDFSKRDFWQGGFTVLDSMLAELTDLVDA